MTAYLAITVHYITDDWTLESQTLAFKELSGAHTGENLSAELWDSVEKFKLARKVFSFCLVISEYTNHHL